jgi:hypothetical protein
MPGVFSVMSDHVSFEWDWQRPEYLAAERDTWAHAPARRRATRRELMWGIALFVPLAAIYASRGILTISTTLFLVLLSTLPWLGARIGEWVGPRIRAWRFARHCLPAYARTSAVIDAAGVTLKWRDSSVQLGWATFTGLVETAEFILLYQSPKSSIFLPKRALSPEQVDMVRTLVQRGIAERGR